MLHAVLELENVEEMLGFSGETEPIGDFMYLYMMYY